MIPKGLKVGDTFVDYKFTYRVTKVVGENYESELVRETSPSAPVDDEPKDELDTMLYSQLKKMCAENGLDAKGSKVDLIERLRDNK